MYEIVVLTIVETCEARVGLFTSQERSGKCFHHCGSVVNLVQPCLCARKHRESSFHHCGGSVKLVQACLSPRNHRESSFHNCGVSGKLLQVCLSA